MGFVTADLIQETSASTNGAALTLAGATTGNRAFSSKMANGDVCWAVANNGAGLFQTALYTWTTGGILTTVAGSVLDGSSGAGAIVTFTGTVTVTMAPISAKVLQVSDDGDFMLPAIATIPAAPAAGILSVFVKNIGGRLMLSQVGPSGLDSAFQPHLGGDRAAWWQPLGNSTTVPITTGIAAATVQGTTTARNVATTNILTRVRRLGHVSAATAGSLAGIYFPLAQYAIGDGTGLGGFTYRFRFSNSDAAAVTGARTFVGMSSSIAAATNVEANTLTNSFGIAQLSTDATQWYIVYGGSAAQTAIALGTTLGAPTLVNTIFEIALFAYPNLNNQVGYTVINLGSGVSVSGTLTGTAGTVLPASTTFLAPRAWRCNNATALAVGIDLSSLYLETDQ